VQCIIYMFKIILIYIKKTCNTFLIIKIIKKDYKNNFKKKLYFLEYISKFLWFIPNNYQKRYWYFADKNQKHDYTKYIHMSGSTNKFVNEIKNYSNSKDKVLDICCNVGRFLDDLNKSGFNDLYGFDINLKAINEMQKIFPNINHKKIKCTSAEEYLSSVDDNFFDITYTYGATIELIHPSFPVIKQISRITKKYFICNISENGQAYPRFWRYEFKKNKFKIVKSTLSKDSETTLFVLKKNS